MQVFGSRRLAVPVILTVALLGSALGPARGEEPIQDALYRAFHRNCVDRNSQTIAPILRATYCSCIVEQLRVDLADEPAFNRFTHRLQRGQLSASDQDMSRRHVRFCLPRS